MSWKLASRADKTLSRERIRPGAYVDLAGRGRSLASSKRLHPLTITPLLFLAHPREGQPSFLMELAGAAFERVCTGRDRPTATERDLRRRTPLVALVASRWAMLTRIDAGGALPAQLAALLVESLSGTAPDGASAGFPRVCGDSDAAAELDRIDCQRTKLRRARLGTDHSAAMQHSLGRFPHDLTLADRDPEKQNDLIGSKDAEVIADEHRYLVAV